MKVSIIVCTYNRAEVLNDCLEALSNQTADSNDFEVLIVNNNSKDNTLEIAGKYVTKNKNFRLITETKQGLSNARNTGYKEVNTEWVGYIDDDAKATPNYVERVLWLIDNHDFDSFGGIDIPWYRDGRPFWYKDSYFGSRLNYLSLSEIKSNEFITGFSMYFKRELLVKADGFSPDLGMTGDTIAYSEETDLQIRLRKMGSVKIGYDPDLVVNHLVPKYKLTLDWFFISSYALGRDSIAMSGANVSSLRIFMVAITTLAFTFLRFLYFTPKLLFKDYYVQNWLRDVFRKTAKRIGIIYTALKQTENNSQTQ